VALLTACGSGSSSKSSDGSLTGFANSQYSHLTATAYTVCAQTKTGILKCWGDGSSYNFANEIGDLMGDDVEEVGDGIPAAQLGDGNVEYAMAGPSFGCAIYEDGELKCWGNKGKFGMDDFTDDTSVYVGDKPGELDNNLPVINLGDDFTVKALSMGDEHACAILSNDRLKCWGSNGYGRLGLGDTDSRGNNAGELGNNLPFVDLGTNASDEPYKVKSVYAGYDRTCAILENDQLKCWGKNNRAQAGYGDFNDRGDEPDEMGNNLPFVDLGTGRSAKQVFAYYVHTCVILDNDELKCWGSNDQGELGLGTGDDFVGNNLPNRRTTECGFNNLPMLYNESQLAPGEQNCEFGGSAIPYGQDTSENGLLEEGEVLDTFVFCHAHDMQRLYSITDIAANESEECGDQTGFEVVRDFDNDGDGLLGDGSQNFMGDALPTIDFGSESAVVDVAQGDDHTCALLADTTLKCWGDNGEAQHGIDSQENEFGGAANEIPAAQTEVDLGEGLYAVAITGGYDFTCALLNNDDIKCWGYDNDSATLGVAEYLDEYIGNGDPQPEMGDALKPVLLFETDAQ